MKVNEQQNNQPSTLRRAVGITTGAAIALSPTILRIYKRGGISEKLLTEKQLLRAQKKMKLWFLEVDAYENIMKAVNEIMEKTGLKKEGVEIKAWAPDMVKDIKRPNKVLTKKEEKKFIKSTNKKKIWAYGLNASFYKPAGAKPGKINIPKEISSDAVFHEIGHALNYYKSRIMKPIQMSRKLSKIATGVVGLTTLVIGLVHNKKPNKDKKSSHEKKADFIHDNAGKLTFLTGIPIIFEEAMASKKGIKLAKPYLTLTQHKQHVKNLSKALGTYIAAPLMFSVLIALGIYVKDKIVNSKTKD